MMMMKNNVAKLLYTFKVLQEMEIGGKIKTPRMPNYILFDDEESNSMSVAKLTKKEAEEYGELMKQAFIKHWEKLSR